MNIAFAISKPGHPFSQWLSLQDTKLTFSEFLLHYYQLVDEPQYGPINDTEAWCRWPGGFAHLGDLMFWNVDCFGDGATEARHRARGKGQCES
jgi:hypothetical protein